MPDFYVLLKKLWLLWFMGLFLGIVAWVYWPGRKRQFEEHASIPLRDDDDMPAPKAMR